jgi:hypothetical protein
MGESGIAKGDNMPDKLIFISCGQSSDQEKALGGRIREIVNSRDGFEAYFAEFVQSAQALAANVLDGLRQCSGAIVVLQMRGTVLKEDGSEWGIRSSVWVNQEVALLAYRNHFEARDIPILAFKDPAIKLEGAMTSLIVNPVEIPKDEDLEAVVQKWLDEKKFAAGSDEDFLEKWNRLDNTAKMTMDCIIAEGGQHVFHHVIRQRITRRYGIEANEAGQQMRDGIQQMLNVGLVFSERGNDGPKSTLSEHWIFHMQRYCAEWKNK